MCYVHLATLRPYLTLGFVSGWVYVPKIFGFLIRFGFGLGICGCIPKYLVTQTKYYRKSVFLDFGLNG
jgi:hypothetical protein